MREKPQDSFPWKLPVRVGTDLLQRKGGKAFLAQWQATPFDWGQAKLAEQIYSKPGRFKILEIDDFVEMMVLNG